MNGGRPAPSGRDRHGVDDLDLADRAGPTGVPAVAQEEAGPGPGQRRPGAGAAPEQLAPVLGDADDRQVVGRRREPACVVVLGLQREPVEAVRAEREVVAALGDRRELVPAEQLDGHHAAMLVQVEGDALGEPRQVGDHQHDLVVVLAGEREDLGVLREQELDVAAAEHLVLRPQRDDPPHPAEQRAGVLLLGLDVDRLVVVLRVDDRRQVELLRVGRGEAGVAVARSTASASARRRGRRGRRCRPCRSRRRSRRPACPAATKSRPFISSILRRSFSQQRRQPAPDAEVDPHLGVGGVGAVHVVALFVGDHLERELVVVAQEDGPLAAVAGMSGVCSRMSMIGKRSSIRSAMNRRGISGKWKAMWHSSPRRAEVGGGVLGPLVGLARAACGRGKVASTCARSSREELVGLGQVLAVRALALEQVGHGVEAHAVDAHLEPLVDHARASSSARRGCRS